MPSQIQSICFDLDDTLWPCEPVIQNAEYVMHQWLAIHYPRVVDTFSITSFQQLRHSLMMEQPLLRYDMTTLRKKSLALAATQVGYDDSLVEPAFNIFLEARHQVTFYPEVISTLNYLHQRYRLCVLTNGNASVHRLGIGHFFEVVLAAGDVGIGKPELEFFHLACQQLHLAPSQIVHVGDDAECDVKGALNAGLQAIWMNRAQKEWTYTYQPNAQVTSLYQLETVLQQLAEGF